MYRRYVFGVDYNKKLRIDLGFHKTEKNVAHNPYVEMSIGSPEVMGRNYMGAGFHLTGTAEFYSDGPLFERMHQERSFCSRVMVFTPETCRQMV